MDLKSFIESLSYCEESNKSLNVKLLVCLAWPGLALAEYFKIGLRYDAQKRYLAGLYLCWAGLFWRLMSHK